MILRVAVNFVYLLLAEYVFPVICFTCMGVSILLSLISITPQKGAFQLVMRIINVIFTVLVNLIFFVFYMNRGASMH